MASLVEANNEHIESHSQDIIGLVSQESDPSEDDMPLNAFALPAAKSLVETLKKLNKWHL